MSIPHSPTPEWAVSCMERIVKLDDPDVLDAVLDLLVGVSGLNDKERLQPAHLAIRDDAAMAAIDFGYRRTETCERHCHEDLGIAV